MWWDGFKARTEVLDIYLGTRRVMCLPSPSRIKDVEGRAPESVAVESFEEALHVIGRLIPAGDSGKMRIKLRIWLSGGLARPFLLNVPAKIIDVEALRIAESMASAQTGLVRSCKVWVEKPNKSGQRVAVAVHADQLQAILDRVAGSNPGQGAPRRKLQLLSIRPWWAEVLGEGVRHKKELQGIAVQDCDSLTVLTGKHHQAKTNSKLVETAQTLSPVADQATADAALMRRLLAIDVDPAVMWRVRLLQEQRAGASELKSGEKDVRSAMALGSYVECGV